MAIANVTTSMIQQTAQYTTALAANPQIAKIALAAGWAFTSSSKSSTEQGFFSSPPLLSAFQNCLTPLCPDLKLDAMNQREKDAISVIQGFFDKLFGLFSLKDTQELIRLNKNDPRDKLLYLVAESDWNGGLNPKWYPKVLQPLAKKFDIKYKVVSSYDEICHEVEDAVKTGKLSYIFINAHGAPNRMWLLDRGPNNSMDIVIDKSELTRIPSCFSGLHPAGKIILFSCCTGSPGTFPDPGCFKYSSGNINNDPSYKPFAQILANFAKRRVIGGVTLTNGDETKLIAIDPLMVDLPGQPPFPKNIFKTFNPDDLHCPDLNQDKLHPREQLAAEAIKTNLVAKSIMLNSVTFHETQDFLRICKNDPREKLLFLDAKSGFHEETDHVADDPKRYAELLSNLSDKFDLKYKVIEFYDDICKEIHDASTAGKVAGVILHSYKAPGSGLLLSKGNIAGQRVLDENTDFTKCFSGIQPSGRIIFIGGSIGAPKENDLYNNLAQKVATISKRTVVASIEPVLIDKIKISSIDPLTVNSMNSNFFPSSQFRIFTPELTTCPPITENQIHPREKNAAEAIKDDFVSSSLLSDSAQIKETQDFLRLCEEDPREKYLYLSAENESTSKLDPNMVKKSLGDLAKKYDLKYKVVTSYDDICKEIKEASTIGKLAGVHIQGNSIVSSLLHKNIDCKQFKCKTLLSNNGGVLLDDLCNKPGILLTKTNDRESKQQCQGPLTSIFFSDPTRWNVIGEGMDYSQCISGITPVPVTIDIIDPTGSNMLAQKHKENDEKNLMIIRIAQALFT